MAFFSAQLVFGCVVWLIALQIAARSVHAITVGTDDTTPVIDGDGVDRNGTQPRVHAADNGPTVTYQSSRLLACSALPADRSNRVLLERSGNSLRLYLLDTTSGILERIELGHAQGIDRVKVCALPAMKDERALGLQVLDVHLGGTAYVLFVVSSSEWHYVYLARSLSADGQQDISSNSSESAQAIQRLKLFGETIRVRLLECSDQLYLVTILTFGNMGKIRIYRWLQSYFSLVGTREVSSLDDIQCHCPGPLLLLALDYAPLPERSMNHVLLLDSTGTAPVKVQGMYFLSNTLPSFMLGGELFLVRQVSKDKSYLYQWSLVEGRFIRQRMVPFHAAQVSAVVNWDDTVAIAIGDAIRLYTANQHNLLRVESPFTVRGNGTVSPPMTELPIGAGVESQALMRLYALRQAGEKDIALVLEYRCSPDVTNGTALQAYQLTKESGMTPRTEASQEQGFHMLGSCLQQLKERLNERKRWIDLMRLQLSKRQSAFEALRLTDPTNKVLLQPTVGLRQLVLPHDNPNLLPPSRTVLNGQTLLLRHYRVATDLNQVLLLNRPRADIEGDLHVDGNIRASTSNIREVYGLEAVTAIGKRSRRSVGPHYREPGRSRPHRIIVAREVIADSTLHKRFWSKSKVTVLPGTVQLDVLRARSVQMSPRAHINRIAVPSERALEEVAASGYGGHKVLPSVHTARLRANSFNGEPLPMQLLANGLHYASDGATIQSDRTHIRNLIVGETVNGFRLDRFVPAHQPLIQGQLVLSDEVCVRYLTVHRTIDGTDRDTLLDRLSVQTLTGPLFISKGFTHSLTVQTLNGEPSSNIAVLPSEGPSSVQSVVQQTVRTAKLTILNALIVDHERQQFSGPHIGTLASDFRQLYRRKVVINGSLRLRRATKIVSPNITLANGQAVISNPEAYQIGQYLLRNRRQVVEHQVTYQAAQLQYLFANTLNQVGLWQLCLTHFNWQNSLYVHDAILRGQIRATRIAARLHSIKRSRVTQHSTISLCNTAKHFQGRLSVAHLRTSAFAAQPLPTAALWLKAGQLYEAAPVTVSSELELHESTVVQKGGTGLHVLTTLARYPADILFRRNNAFAGQQLRLTTLEADLLIVHRVEKKVPLGPMVQRFATTRMHLRPEYGNSTDNRHWSAPSLVKIVLDPAAPIQHIPLLAVGDINVCPIARLLAETIGKHDTGHRRPIEGYKSVHGSLTVTEELRATQLNSHPAHILRQVVTRDRDAGSSPVRPQMIESRWQFGSIIAPYFTAKILNRTPLALVALRTDANLPLHGELFIERLHLHGLQWPYAAMEGVHLDGRLPQHPIAAINRCRCYGTVVDPTGKDRTLVAPHELLLFAPLPGTDRQPIESVVIFNTTEVHLGSVMTQQRDNAIERIAELCLRFNHSTSPFVFHREQLLLGVPTTTTVRQSLRIGSGASLSVRRVAEVPIAERLAPGGASGVFLLGQMPVGVPVVVVGRKRFTITGVATVRNLTLATGDSRLMGVLLATGSGAPHETPLAVNLDAGAIVEHRLTATQLNYAPFEWFFHAFFRLHPPTDALNSKVPPPTLPARYIQDFRGTLTVANLHLRGSDTILHHINGIPLTDVVTRSTENAGHQIVTGPKAFRSVRLGGPLSLHHYNGIAVASIKQKIVLAKHQPPVGTRRKSQLPPRVGDVRVPNVIIFNRPVKLDALWSKHTYESRTASTVLSMDDAAQRSVQQSGYTDSVESLLASLNQHQRHVLPAARLGAMNRRRSNIDTSYLRSVPLARTTGAVSGGIRFDCSPDRLAIMVMIEDGARGHSPSEPEYRSVPIGMGQGPTGHCQSVLGVAAINSTTNLLLVTLQASNETDTGRPVLYTADRRTHQLRPLEMPHGVAKSRAVRGAGLLTPDRETIMLALLEAPAASAHASPTVHIFRLENPLTPSAPELLRFAPFQTVSSAAHISALQTSADGSVLVLHEHIAGRQQQQHLYEYNSVAGWTESTRDHLV